MTETQYNKKVEQIHKYKQKIKKIYDEIHAFEPEWAYEIDEYYCEHGEL